VAPSQPRLYGEDQAKGFRVTVGMAAMWSMWSILDDTYGICRYVIGKDMVACLTFHDGSEAKLLPDGTVQFL
jgi:hypothetical protein